MMQQHLRIVKAIMVLSGSWRVKMTSLNQFQLKLYKLYSLITNAYLYCFVPALCVGAVSVWNTDKIMQAIPLIILFTIMMLKTIICQRRKVTEMLSKIEIQEKAMYKWDEDTVRIYSKNARYTQWLSLYMFTATYFCGITLPLTKLIDYEQQMKAAKLGLLNESLIEKPLLYFVWRPVDENKHYWQAFSLDVLSDMVSCIFNIATQIIFISLITYIMGQLKILQNKFRNFGSTCANLTTYEEKFLALKKLILQHLEIINFVKDLDSNMKYLLLLEFTINSFQITGILYELIVFEKTFVVIFRVIYLYCMVLQAFLLAWHANEVNIQSTEIASAIYDCQWYDLPKKIKDMLLIIMIRAQKPLSLSIGPFFTLRNSTAVTSMKGAYSYLAVLINKK